eukprot:13297370-Alexandrium_andersonii.AAC.1
MGCSPPPVGESMQLGATPQGAANGDPCDCRGRPCGTSRDCGTADGEPQQRPYPRRAGPGDAPSARGAGDVTPHSAAEGSHG